MDGVEISEVPDSDSEPSDESDNEETLELPSLSLSAATLVEVLEKIQEDQSVLQCSLGQCSNKL